MTVSPTERVPPMSELVAAAHLERCLRPWLVNGIDGIAVFDRSGISHARVWNDGSPIAVWDQLPPEAAATLHRDQTVPFGIAEHLCEATGLLAGSDHVGSVVVSRRREAADGMSSAIATALSEILHFAYATWVTSQLHLQTSASAWRALAQQNAELLRAVEQMRQLDELKSNFLATVSHELRTPLTSVIGFSEMLVEGVAGELNPEQADYVRTILSRGEELLGLITHVLEMSQLEAGAVRLQLEAMAVGDLVDGAADALRLVADQSEITVVREIPALPPMLVDREKMHRVLVNLIGNAIKFSPRGSQVTVRAIAAPIRRPFIEETLFGEEAADAIRITVSDRGIGIASDQLTRIFEPFYQADSGPTRRHGGAGLGLSIVRNILRAHGGEAWAESTLGAGTDMHVTVPAASAQAAPG